MRLGVEAALVDGALVPGDVEIEGGTIAAVALSGGRGRGIAGTKGDEAGGMCPRAPTSPQGGSPKGRRGPRGTGPDALFRIDAGFREMLRSRADAAIKASEWQPAPTASPTQE